MTSIENRRRKLHHLEEQLGIPIPIDELETELRGRPVADLSELDHKLQQQDEGYRSKTCSAKEYIEHKFGNAVARLLEEVCELTTTEDENNG